MPKLLLCVAFTECFKIRFVKLLNRSSIEHAQNEFCRKSLPTTDIEREAGRGTRRRFTINESTWMGETAPLGTTVSSFCQSPVSIPINKSKNIYWWQQMEVGKGIQGFTPSCWKLFCHPDSTVFQWLFPKWKMLLSIYPLINGSKKNTRSDSTDFAQEVAPYFVSCRHQ